MNLFGWLFKKQKEYNICKIDIVEYNKEAGDKLIIRVGDERHEASEDDINKIVNVFNGLINNKSDIVVMSQCVNITIMKKGGKN